MQTMAILWVFFASFLIAINVVNAENIGEELLQAATLDSVDEEDQTVERRSFGFRANVQCPCGWSNISTSCYLFVKTEVTWDEARADCLSRGGDLAIPRSNSECNNLSEHAMSLDMQKPWIGLYRRRFDNKFYNTCGKTLSFTRWAPGEPNDYEGVKEGCGHMYASGDRQGHWNDVPCQNEFGYICEYQIPRCD